MMWWPHEGWNAGWMVVMILGWAALLAVGIWAVVALTRGQSPPPAAPRSETPREILDRRLAAGEITSQEYLEARQLLQGRTTPPPTPG